ncbi:MAG: PqqD family protein [Prevotellaceae bacterium]|jgi:deoxyribodipyrimidine photolyase|nr:PqqD family protein [Prevotellaceae bacterium]
MKVNPHFKLHHVGDEHILINEGKQEVNFNHLISLNDTAAGFWQEVADGREFDVESFTNYLTDHYEVDRDTAARDAGASLSQWLEAGIVTQA